MSKEFVGNVKVKDMTGPTGAWQYTQISFKTEDLEKMKGFMNDKGYVNLKLNRSQKGSEYLEIDTYGLNNNPCPEPQQAQPAPQQAQDKPFEAPPMPDFKAPLQDDLEF